MNSIPLIITDYSITLVIKGKPYTANAGQTNFSIIKQRIADGKFDGIEQLFDSGAALSSFTKGNISIKDNAVFYKGQPVHNYVVERILAFMREGLPYKPLVNFLDKLMQNPSFRAVQELYGFLEATNLPITEDGDFLAYRKVTEDYKDFYTRKFDNSIGSVVEIPRNTVDEDKNRTCSHGLHFASISYIPHYHGGAGRVVIVKINPADVCAIPVDYKNAKGRCCKYMVYAECKGGESGENFSSPLFRTAPTENEKDLSYKDGYAFGFADAEHRLEYSADEALCDSEGVTCKESFLEGYDDGYYDALNKMEIKPESNDCGGVCEGCSCDKASPQVSEATRAKLSDAAKKQKRDANSRFI